MTESEAAPVAPAASAEPSGSRRPVLAAVAVVGVLVAGSAALGAFGGWLWYQWWGPPNKGSIYDTTDGIRWLDPSDQGIAHQFNGPAEYAVIAVGFGILLGVLGALLGRRHALLALAALVVGSALAAYLSWAVGTTLSPPDPDRYATKANVCQQAPCKEYDAAIEVSGWSPFLAWPIGTLGGFSAAVVVSQWVSSFRRSQASQREAGAWLAAPGSRQDS